MQHTTPICGEIHPTLQRVDALFDQAERLLMSDTQEDMTAALDVLRVATITLRRHSDILAGETCGLYGYLAMPTLDAAAC